MKHTPLISSLALLSTLTIIPLASAQSLPYREQLVDLWARHTPTALSPYGWVASVKHPHQGFYWDAISPINSTVFSAYQELVIQDINSSNQFVGYDFSVNQAVIGHLPTGAQVSLPYFPGCSIGARVPLALSETGIAAGFAVCPGTRPRAMLYKPGIYVTLVGLSGPDSSLEDISPSGQYTVGWQGTLNNMYSPPPIDYSTGSPSKYYYGAPDPTVAFRYDIDASVLEPLTQQLVGLPAGAQLVSTTALSVNDDGATVGYVTYKVSGLTYERPVLWPNPHAGWILPMPTTYSHGCRATSINSAWQLVASCFRLAYPQQTQESFVWDPTHGSRQLFPLTQNPSAGYLAATDINDYGQITVSVQSGQVDPGVALLTPTSVPYGACLFNNQCYQMYANQCDGHNGSFAPYQACSLEPPLEAAEF